MGLVSSGGVHSSIDHLFSLIDLAKKNGLDEVYIHAILDGRDTQYNSGLNFVKEMENNFSRVKVGKIATISGRFYAMDRDNHWERIAKAYYAMVLGQGGKSDNPVKAIEESYKRKVYDEEFVPTVITEKGAPRALIGGNDSVIFFNFRSDRARQLTKAFVLPGFNKFERPEYLKDLCFICFTEYDKELPVEFAFSPKESKNGLGEIISKAGL